ncbi:MAG TPA: hypothetical protein GX507_08920 [Clostridia bacterium]|nr:hypothetical protein [Clostridia bacterium]
MVRAVFVHVIPVVLCTALAFGLVGGCSEPRGNEDAGDVRRSSPNTHESAWRIIVREFSGEPGALPKTHLSDKASVHVVVISEGGSSSLTPVHGLGFDGAGVMGVTPLDVIFLPTSREVVVDRGVMEGISLVLRARALRPVTEGRVKRPARLYIYDITGDGKVLLGYRGRVALIGPGLVSGLVSGFYSTRGASATDAREDEAYPSGLIVENLGFWYLGGGISLESGVTTDHAGAYASGVAGREVKARRTPFLFPPRVLKRIAKSLAWGEYFRDSLALVPQKNLVILVSERWLGKGPLYERETSESDKEASTKSVKAERTSDETLHLTRKPSSDRLGLEDLETVAFKTHDSTARPPSGQSILVIRELRIAGLNTDFETLFLRSQDLPLILSRMSHRAAGRLSKTEGYSSYRPLFDDEFYGPGVMLYRAAHPSHIGIRFFPVDTEGDVATERPGVRQPAKAPSRPERDDTITVKPGETVRCIWGLSPRAQHAVYGVEDRGVKDRLDENAIEVIVPPILESIDQCTRVETEDLSEDLKGNLLTSLSEGGGVCAIFVSNLGEFRVADWGVTGRNDR